MILVPTPGSGVLPKLPPTRVRALSGPLWVAREVCRALRGEGFGAEVWEGLRRTQAVPKSAFAAPGQRPTLLRHYGTLHCEPRLFAGRVTIVDDFLTKGRTLLAAATRVHESLPQAEVRAFALVRTMNLAPDIDRVVEPTVGTIRCLDDDAVRDP